MERTNISEQMWELRQQFYDKTGYEPNVYYIGRDDYRTALAEGHFMNITSDGKWTMHNKKIVIVERNKYLAVGLDQQ